MALNHTIAVYIPKLLLLLLFFLPVILGVVFLGWQRSVRIVHQDSGLSGHCFFGYSWTYFLFGFFVPIFRGEILIGLLHFLLSVITFGIFQIIMPFLYNKQYLIFCVNQMNERPQQKCGLLEKNIEDVKFFSILGLA